MKQQEAVSKQSSQPLHPLNKEVTKIKKFLLEHLRINDQVVGEVTLFCSLLDRLRGVVIAFFASLFAVVSYFTYEGGGNLCQDIYKYNLVE